MAVVFISFMVSVVINILLSKKLVDKATDMVTKSVEETLNKTEGIYAEFLKQQEEGTAQYWYVKGLNDAAKGIKELLAKIDK